MKTQLFKGIALSFTYLFFQNFTFAQTQIDISVGATNVKHKIDFIGDYHQNYFRLNPININASSTINLGLKQDLGPHFSLLAFLRITNFKTEFNHSDFFIHESKKPATLINGHLEGFNNTSIFVGPSFHIPINYHLNLSFYPLAGCTINQSPEVYLLYYDKQKITDFKQHAEKVTTLTAIMGTKLNYQVDDYFSVNLFFDYHFNKPFFGEVNYELERKIPQGKMISYNLNSSTFGLGFSYCFTCR